MRIVRLVFCAALPASLAGCYAAAAGIVVGLLSLSDQGGGSTASDPAPANLVLIERAAGGDHVVIDYEAFDKDGGCLDPTVEWQLTGKDAWHPATLYAGTVRRRSGGEAATSVETCLEKAGGEVKRFTYVWQARADLRDKEGVSAGQTRIRMTLRDPSGRSSQRTSDPLIAGNEPPEILDLRLEEGAPMEGGVDDSGGLVAFAVKVKDSTSDDVTLRGRFWLGAAEPADEEKRPMTQAFRATPYLTSPDGEDDFFLWRSSLPTDLGSRFRTDVHVEVLPDDGFETGAGKGAGPITIDNNREPEVDFIPLAAAPDLALEIPIRMVVRDPEADRASVVLQWAAAGERFPDLPLGDLALLKLLISPVDPDAGPLFAEAISELRANFHLLTEAPLRLRGLVACPKEPGTTGRVILSDLARDGLLYRQPPREGPGPLPEGILGPDSGAFVVGREILISHGELGSARARIEAFSPDTSEATLEPPAPVFPGSSYEITIQGTLADLWNTPDGVLHTFIWDSAADLEAAGAALDATVQLRASAFDSQVGGKSSESNPLKLQSGPLVEAQALRAGDDAGPILIGDFSGDGRQDMLVAHARPDDDARISLHVQSMEGRFSEGADADLRLPISAGARVPRTIAMASGHVVGGAQADLVVVLSPESEVAVYEQPGTDGNLLGEGTDPVGGVAQRVPSLVFPSRRQPVAVAIGDFLGGPEAEIVVATTRDRLVTIHERSDAAGAPPFHEALSFDFELRPRHLALGDIDSDGAIDIAVAGFTEDEDFAAVLLGDPTRSYPPSVRVVRLEALGAPSGLAIADLTNDGKEDLAIAFEESDRVAIYAQPFAGGLEPVPPSIELHTGRGPVAIATADLNGDGRTDVAAANQIARNVSIFLQQRSGSFLGDPLQSLPNPSIESIAAGDVDGDGLADLVAARSEADSIAIFRQTFSGEVRSAQELVLEPGRSVDLAMICDVSSDGRKDVISLSRDGRRVSVYDQRETGEPSSRPTFELETGSSPVAFAAGDLNGDGGNDVTVASEGAGVEIYFQKPTGKLGVALEEESVHGPDETRSLGGKPSGIAVSDVNADGRSDLLVAVEDLHVVKVFHQGPARRLASEAVELRVGDFPVAVLSGDLNHDGRKDVLVFQRAPDALGTGMVFRQDQDGGLVEAQVLKISNETSSEPRSAVIADLNGDGRDDVAIAPTGGNEVRIFHQDASGMLGLPDTSGLRRWDCSVHSGSPPIHISSGDLNGDERPDLVITTDFDLLARLFLQPPGLAEAGMDPCERSFEDAGQFGGGVSTTTAVGDLTGDGRAELAIATGRTGTLLIFVGR